ncbi:hypothetical protein P692DRAFT_20878964 [Suillus brevipes Sb2]|nr:hypothetical protein P692DRAFT_20878964 [Suillus brevipes Sb2]
MAKFLDRLHCPYCGMNFKSQRGRTKHIRTIHAYDHDDHICNDQVPASPRADSDFNDTRPDLEDESQEFADTYLGDLDADAAHAETDHKRPIYGKIEHPYLFGRPCDAQGNPLPPGAARPPRGTADDDWPPFANQADFLLADFLFRKVEMSGSDIDFLMELWAFRMQQLGEAASSPFISHKDVYATIDSIRLGDVPWECLSVDLGETIPDDAPSWAERSYQVWYRNPDTIIKNMLDNPDFHQQFDYAPHVTKDHHGQRKWQNFMSGNYAWRQCDKIYNEDPSTEGATYVGIILGSEKTTVSVATGNVEYHPLYLSIGNPHNGVRRAHCNAVTPIGFLAIPKAERKYDNDVAFRKFKRQLYHASISAILQPLKPGMETPLIRRCPDGHYRRVIYDLAAYIADYPEQLMVAGIVQNWCAKCTALPEHLDGVGGRRTREFMHTLVDTLSPGHLWDQYGIDSDIVPFTYDFPRADIYAMLTPDLLHQVIKGTFKDHLVAWTEIYLAETHGEAHKDVIMDDIDRRIAAVPAFTGLRRFPQGRCFKQWTGDDSKALMKVFLPAIAEYVPPQLVQCIAAFLDFCYLVRHHEIGEDTLTQIEEALEWFYAAREIFRDSGVRPTGFSLPRQHALVHYSRLIQEYGAPNGLCSSITESRHITAVKWPWRRSNRYNALGQMLLTNQCLDKLGLARVDFVAQGMLPSSVSIPSCGHDGLHKTVDEEAIDEDIVPEARVEMARRRQRGYPRALQDLAAYISEPLLPALTGQFLHDQMGLDDSMPLPEIISPISIFHSASATFYAPSDLSGTHGVRREIIDVTDSDKENLGKRRPRSPTLEDGVHSSPVKKKRHLIRRLPLPLSKLGYNSSPLPVEPEPEVLQTPVPPYRQTPAPVIVSQNYLHRLIVDRWDAEVKRCEEGRKAQLLEVQLAAHGIRKLV